MRKSNQSFITILYHLPSHLAFGTKKAAPRLLRTEEQPVELDPRAAEAIVPSTALARLHDAEVAERAPRHHRRIERPVRDRHRPVAQALVAAVAAQRRPVPPVVDPTPAAPSAAACSRCCLHSCQLALAQLGPHP